MGDYAHDTACAVCEAYHETDRRLWRSLRLYHYFKSYNLKIQVIIESRKTGKQRFRLLAVILLPSIETCLIKGLFHKPTNPVVFYAASAHIFRYSG